MPRGDGTGPSGLGPMTGRAAGYCAGYQVPGFANPIPGRGSGFGFGRGLGLGFRGGRRFNPYSGYGVAPNVMSYGVEVTPQNEIEALQMQAKSLEDTLNQINKRITELDKAKTDK
ncbi:DUF5320 domain-containing protein [candidate division KSB1 bacterium]|nr:DUF5320 domain-containing protein [candidate division KSB1 bacterium]